MELFYGTPRQIDAWMELVSALRSVFPGLETEQALTAHRQTVLKFMDRKEALWVRQGEMPVGVLLFSRSKNQICCLGVLPEYRRQGVASCLLKEALRVLDRGRDITVSTFRAKDPKGAAPRALYRKFGFQEGELTLEFGYPNQMFVLPACREGAVEAETLRMETARLLLYPVGNSEMAALIEAERDPDLKQAYGEMLELCLRNPAHRRWYAVWYLERKDSPGTVVGDLSFKGPCIDGVVELGYGLRSGCCGQGYMTEAVAAVTSWALAQTGVTRVEAETAPENTASQRVLLRAGYRPTGSTGEEGPRFFCSCHSPAEPEDS